MGGGIFVSARRNAGKMGFAGGYPRASLTRHRAGTQTSGLGLWGKSRAIELMATGELF